MLLLTRDLHQKQHQYVMSFTFPSPHESVRILTSAITFSYLVVPLATAEWCGTMAKKCITELCHHIVLHFFSERGKRTNWCGERIWGLTGSSPPPTEVPHLSFPLWSELPSPATRGALDLLWERWMCLDEVIPCNFWFMSVSRTRAKECFFWSSFPESELLLIAAEGCCDFEGDEPCTGTGKTEQG